MVVYKYLKGLVYLRIGIAAVAVSVQTWTTTSMLRK